MAHSELLEVGRLAIEDELIMIRDDGISELLRNNGFIIKNYDGSRSDIIRFGPEHGLRIGIKAMLKELKGMTPKKKLQAIEDAL